MIKNASLSKFADAAQQSWWDRLIKWFQELFASWGKGHWQPKVDAAQALTDQYRNQRDQQVAKNELLTKEKAQLTEDLQLANGRANFNEDELNALKAEQAAQQAEKAAQQASAKYDANVAKEQKQHEQAWRAAQKQREQAEQATQNLPENVPLHSPTETSSQWDRFNEPYPMTAFQRFKLDYPDFAAAIKTSYPNASSQELDEIATNFWEPQKLKLIQKRLDGDRSNFPKQVNPGDIRY